MRTTWPARMATWTAARASEPVRPPELQISTPDRAKQPGRCNFTMFRGIYALPPDLQVRLHRLKQATQAGMLIWCPRGLRNGSATSPGTPNQHASSCKTPRLAC